jgi:hypothetical protein
MDRPEKSAQDGHSFSPNKYELCQVHPANEYAPVKKVSLPWFAKDDPKGFSSIPRLLSEL